MFIRLLRTLITLALAANILLTSQAQAAPSAPSPQPASAPAASKAPSAAGLSVFRNPVVPGAVISGYFDHNPASGYVTFYDGYRNVSPAYGFYFSCSNPAMYDFVGCIDNVSGVNACAPERQLWYDDHHGTDYEYSPNWYTGAYCDPGRFAGITHQVFAPARGMVFMAGYDPNRPANGWHIRMKHDLNGNGNWDDDNFRSVYLHFTANALAVYPGQIVNEGDYLGLGGSTGYSSSPHLHFEVQRSADQFQTTYWPVDPYGWQGAGSDPWSYTNVSLWKVAPQPSNISYVPVFIQEQGSCTDCGPVQLIQNGGFESGQQGWDVQGVDIITNTGDTYLKIAPYKGSWLSWLAGRNYANDSVSQSFKLPSGAKSATFQYYLRMDTAEKGGVYDVMNVTLRDANGTEIRKMDYVDNTFDSPRQWVSRTVDLADVQPWAGQTLTLTFTATTDSNTITSFYLDEVSWIVQ